MGKVVVHLIRGSVVKGRLPALLIVIADSARQPLSQRATGIKRAQVKVVILYSPPQTLDEDVVRAAAPAMHADFHLASLEHLDEGCASL